MTYAGGSGKQDFDAGSQRNKVYRAVDESRHHQVPCPPQGKEAGKAEKPDAPVIPHGKQTVKQLIGQNQGVSNIEITDPSIKEFEKIAEIRRGLCGEEGPQQLPTQVPDLFQGSGRGCPDRCFYRVHREKGQKGGENRAPVRAGKAEPVQRTGKTRRRGPEQAEGAGTMKKPAEHQKAHFAESAVYPDGAFLHQLR